MSRVASWLSVMLAALMMTVGPVLGAPAETVLATTSPGPTDSTTRRGTPSPSTISRPVCSQKSASCS